MFDNLVNNNNCPGGLVQSPLTRVPPGTEEGHMQVKGTAVQTIPLFIKKKFGEEGHKKWLGRLSEAVRLTFSMTILDVAWFPLNAGVVEPTVTLCDLFYGGSMEGAVEQGRFSAECGLPGIYKLQVTQVSPDLLVYKAGEILQSYYQPCTVEIVEKSPKSASVRITRFDTPHLVIEHRIKGWIERALQVSGAVTPDVHVTESMAGGARYTVFVASWN